MVYVINDLEKEGHKKVFNLFILIQADGVIKHKATNIYRDQKMKEFV